MEKKLTRKEIHEIMEVLLVANELTIDFAICREFEIVGGINYYVKELLQIVSNGSYDTLVFNIADFINDLVQELLIGSEKCKAYEFFSKNNYAQLTINLKNKWLTGTL